MLELKHVNAAYENLHVLKGINLKVESGTIIALIGANGAGKTTTLKTISGLVSSKDGEMWFEGKRIENILPYDRVKLGICHIPEGGQVFPQMTILENLKMGAYVIKDKQKVLEAVDIVFSQFPVLYERRHKKARTLSGGQRQMLAIGRGLMSRPRLLLMDEPSLGLAPLVVKEIAKIIKQLNDTGVTILLVEQNAKMALDLSHRGYVMEVGRITLQDNAESLRKNDHVKRAYLGG